VTQAGENPEFKTPVDPHPVPLHPRNDKLRYRIQWCSPRITATPEAETGRLQFEARLAWAKITGDPISKTEGPGHSSSARMLA
jgi:hypothetical protein